MSEQIYQPKACAFHPKELIFNFCKHSECLLPLCPSCVKVHSQEHKAEQSYGQFQNITKSVDELSGFFKQTVKELNCCSQQIKDMTVLRGKEQEDIKKKIFEAKSKMMTLVERFFTDFQKEVVKSIVCYNDSMRENCGKVEDRITEIKKEVEEKCSSLGGDKVLKVLIGFYAKREEQKYIEDIEAIRNRIGYLQEQKVEVITTPAISQKVIDDLGNYIHLNFQNWQNQIKYVAEFVKTGFTELSGAATTRT